MARLVCRILASLCMILLFGSCVMEYAPNMEDTDYAEISSNNVTLLLNIKPLAASSSSSVVNPTEKIKTLRVIIIGKGENESLPDTIECNRLFDIPEPVAKDFSYIVRWNSNSGHKDIFVIANEGSVDDGLTTLLEGFEENELTNDFMARVNDYYFTPQYTADDKNNIFLPYTFSQQDIVPKAGVVNTVNAWLIPVATKFVFNFVNYRPAAMNVNEISMKYANKANYLLARPGPDELEKEYNGKMMGWADWLAEISNNSWLYPDFGPNEDYNDEVGWIVDYELPDPDDKAEYTFFNTNVAGEVFKVDAGTTTEKDGVETTDPGRRSTPVYYLPESANFELLGADQSGQTTPGGDGQDEEPAEQRFYLTMLFEDTAAAASTPPVFRDVAIPNLKALFRNTYVIINVTMSEGDIELYAEIADWNHKTANGWVNEGNAPSNNPFTIKKKW